MINKKKLSHCKTFKNSVGGFVRCDNKSDEGQNSSSTSSTIEEQLNCEIQNIWVYYHAACLPLDPSSCGLQQVD